MRKLKRKKDPYGKPLIIITMVLALNLIGVSYAYWTADNKIINDVSVGNMEMVFVNDYTLAPMDGVKDLSVLIDDEKLNINAQVNPGYEGTLTYTLKNVGSIPVIIQGEVILPAGKKSFNLAINSTFKRTELEYTQWNNK